MEFRRGLRMCCYVCDAVICSRSVGSGGSHPRDIQSQFLNNPLTITNQILLLYQLELQSTQVLSWKLKSPE